jgi:hypothetical protein
LKEQVFAIVFLKSLHCLLLAINNSKISCATSFAFKLELTTTVQGCIFWPFPPPLEGGRGRGTFWSLGKKIGPSREKNFRIKIFYRKPFLNYILSFKN